jgi:hypothetical protein
LLFYFLEHALPSGFRWSDAATQICIIAWQEVIDDWGRPSAGKGSSTMTIEILSIQEPCQHRARNFPGATADESLVGDTCAHLNAQKIIHAGYPLCTAPMLNHEPASICPRNWHDTHKRLFRRAFLLMPGNA